MKCWKSAFNAQGWKLIIVAVQVVAVKIYPPTTVEALKKRREIQGETQLSTKAETSPHP
jgi:hypothetical protein